MTSTETPGITRDGYWLDKNLFYFLAERIEPSLGRMISVPSIVNCEADKVEELIPLDVLADLLSGQISRPVDLEALSSAEFDMPDRDTLAVSVDGRDYLIDWCQRRVIEARASLEMPALFSPDGRYACFLKGHDIWLKERETGVERPLTTDGTEHAAYGQQSETSLAPISYRERPFPLGLWSPDSQWFLTHRIDERSLPERALVQHVPPGGGRPILHTCKSSLTDDPVPIATYAAIHIASARVVTFDDFPVDAATFSPLFLRRVWFGVGATAWCVRVDRYYKHAELIQLDLTRGTGRIVLSETVSSGYLELHPFIVGAPNICTLVNSNEVIWFSERDGWGHLYLYDAATGRLKNQITRGEWLVRDIVYVDETQRKMFFLAGGIDPEVDPVRRSLCSVNFDGSGFETLLKDDADIDVRRTNPGGLNQDRPFRPSYASPGISPDARFGVICSTSVDRGNRTAVVDLRTLQGCEIASALPASDEVVPRRFSALAADGVTRLYGVMFLPSDFDAGLRYPLIDYIYPGPQLTQQPQQFRSHDSALARSLAELGFVVVMFDTRGMPYRSRALHQVGYGELLEPQLSDHAAVVRQLCEQHAFLDGDRIGMVGQSSGGAATARALFDYGDIFKVGVSVCGVHDASLYCSIWSDKYRGVENRATWAQQANGAAAHKLDGKLLLISGDMDQNVSISQTLALTDALIRANKGFDLLIVPNAGHDVLTTNGYVQRRAWDYFVHNLLDETLPVTTLLVTRG